MNIKQSKLKNNMGRTTPAPPPLNAIKVAIDCPGCGSKEGSLKNYITQCVYCGRLVQVVSNDKRHVLEIHKNICTVRRIKKAKKW